MSLKDWCQVERNADGSFQACAFIFHEYFVTNGNTEAAAVAGLLEYIGAIRHFAEHHGIESNKVLAIEPKAPA